MTEHTADLRREIRRLRDERDLARMRYAKAALAEDLLRAFVAGIESGYPLADGSWEGDVLERAKAVLDAKWTIVPTGSK